MKKKATYGVVGVTAVVLTAMFTGLIPGFGTGSGSGDGTNTVQADTGEQPANPTEETTSDSAETPDNPPPAETKPTPEEPAAPPQELIQVVVENDRYGLQIADGRFKVASMQEVIEAAQSATGNEDGIRVRILRKPSAKVVAWSTLSNELEKAGIAKNSILIPKKLVD